MNYVCVKTYLLEGELDYINSVTSRNRRFCPLCGSPVVRMSEIDFDESSFSKESEELENLIQDFNEKVVSNV